MSAKLKINEELLAVMQRDLSHSKDSVSIMSDLDTTTYHWCLTNDTITWGDNIHDIKNLALLKNLTSGSEFSKKIVTGKASDRAEVIINSPNKNIGSGVPYRLTTILAFENGERVMIKDIGRWFSNEIGEPIYARGMIRRVDSSLLEEAKDDAEDQSTHRTSRANITATLNTGIQHAKHTRSAIAFLLVSIDNLARINDAYGYEVADEVLEMMMERLERLLRGGDVLGRFTGNKIGIVMHRCNHAEMKIAAERFIECVEDKPFSTSVGEIASSVTIGGAVAPDQASNLQDMLAKVQEALSHARETRRGTFEVYTPSEQREVVRRENARITEEVIHALNNKRMALAFQPIVNAQLPRDTVYYEVLLRLKRIDGTTIGAPAVMALAERLGLVRLIDKQILDLSVAEMMRSPELKLSINVTPASTMDDEWIDNLKSHIEACPNLMERMIVEITETSAILDINETKRFVRQVKELGGRVAIDDFGAGYTSFKNLRLLGVDIVKLDGSFIENIENSEDDQHFVETLLNLANHMGLATVAEWVQSEKTATRLADLGCQYLQGYYTGAASEKRPWLKG